MPTNTKPQSDLGGYLVLKTLTVRDVNGESSVHPAGTVLSGWEVEEYVQGKIAEGSMRYRTRFEPLTVREVADRREKATALEGDRNVDGNMVSPPWPDYVGLHPEEILTRLHGEKDRNVVERAKLYERAGLNRPSVVDYVAPVEREPWGGYDDTEVREILAKLEILSDEQVSEVVSYEYGHKKRPAIVSYSREDEEVIEPVKDEESAAPTDDVKTEDDKKDVA